MKEKKRIPVLPESGESTSLVWKSYTYDRTTETFYGLPEEMSLESLRAALRVAEKFNEEREILAERSSK